MLLSQSLLQSVLNITLQAGEYLKEFYKQDINIYIKSDKTPVTNADLFLHQFIIEQLNKLTPNIPVLSEESCNLPLSERLTWDAYWLIDPLDGTQQFINKTDQFSIIISLVQNHIPTLGVIHSPILKQTYYAMKNYGAHKLVNNKEIQLHPKTLSEASPIKISIGSIGTKNQLQKLLNPNQAYEFKIYGSSSLKTTLVANGDADCYIRLGKTGEWDTAAAEILLSEIGGAIYDLQFQPLTYNQRETLINPDFIMVIDNKFDWRTIFNTKS
ncbi:3'(2'), 5'-bisphosphate nucleotidase [Bisgaardia hudsonensis]|uniref:3'(2'),5'-bisphosphate nucleotidase CysQ n=1 Tax=Bisgaardia hudsonensis TaxID=109472 RepID=A0A4R2MV64_9PAST|nr:3'(2'),5'-bisphosphate nucleotidase CysQ [Bisgaardia hudsonensis]QLB13707.1 3'(2'),5'-bisphosphate nucleotidase [Bisgaardia hudsonensis]TCP12043.1 3'(2'), 5'-bisphosphate nucleotidase [Bisgaardia hudsonensis]